MALQPLSTSSQIVVFNDDVSLKDKTAIKNHQGATIGDILALSGASAIPGQVDVTADGTDITTTAELDYKVNKITATSSDYAVKLPEPQLGGIVGIVNNSSVDVYVFPYDANDSIVGLNPGQPYIVPADGLLYNILCVQNPGVGVWSVSTPTSNNTVKKTVSVTLTADGSYTVGDYSYSNEPIAASLATYTIASGNYYMLAHPDSLTANQVDLFDTTEFNNYNKVRINKFILKSNIPAGDLSTDPAQVSSTLFGLTNNQFGSLLSGIRTSSFIAPNTGALSSILDNNNFNELYSVNVNQGISTGFVGHYMGTDGSLYQMITRTFSGGGWTDINDANGNRRIFYNPYVGYGSNTTPASGYPAQFSFECEMIVEFEFSM